MKPIPPATILKSKGKLVRAYDALTKIESFALDVETIVKGGAKETLADILDQVADAITGGAFGSIPNIINKIFGDSKIIREIEAKRDLTIFGLENRYLFNGTVKRRRKRVYSRN